MDFLKELFLFFIIYAFLGWILEVVFHVFTLKKLVNRGFLYGPLCPIYGFGAIIMLLLLDQFRDNILLVFFIGMIAASILEFITGYILEYLFNAKWWDYSDMKYNIKGYISLSFSITWGVASIFLVELLHPGILKIVEAIDRSIIEFFLPILFIILFLDLVFTIMSLIEFRKLLIYIDDFNKELVDRIYQTISVKKIKESILDQEAIKIFEKKIKDLIDQKSITYRDSHKRLLRSYPSLLKNSKKKLEKIIKKNK